MRLLIVSYLENINEGVVEVIDYYLSQASLLTNVFVIKHTEGGGEIATIKSAYFTSPTGIVAVKDRPSVLSEIEHTQSPRLPYEYVSQQRSITTDYREDT